MESAAIIDQQTIAMIHEMDAWDEESHLLLELIDEFLLQLDRLSSEMEFSVLHNAHSNLAAQAHTLKGACLNMGALALFQACDSLETLARRKDLLTIEEPLLQLKRTYVITKKAFMLLRQLVYTGDNLDNLFVSLQHTCIE